jgi:hypothetical protein
MPAYTVCEITEAAEDTEAKASTQRFTEDTQRRAEAARCGVRSAALRAAGL